jgi:hypothetical protein
MTKTFLSLATAFSIVTFTATADDYYFGQNGYYAPQYYPPPAVTPASAEVYPNNPPPSPASPPPPATTYNNYPSMPSSTVTIYNNNNPPPQEFSFWQPRPFFHADIGPAYFQDSRMKQYDVPANDHIQYKMGGAINVAAGYTFNPYMAADLELGFWGARVDRINFFTFDRADLYELPVTANIIAQVPLQGGAIIPYAGGGMGGSVAIFDARNFTTPANPTINGSEADVVFAGQLFAGVRFRLNPKMWLGAEYRFFCTTQPHWDYPNGFKLSIGGLEADAILFTFNWRF